jgi:hypothetical protein
MDRTIQFYLCGDQKYGHYCRIDCNCFVHCNINIVHSGAYTFGLIQLATFPLAPLVTTIATLTLAINKATAYIAGLIIENKDMKDEKSLRKLLQEELEPLKDDLKSIKTDLGLVKTELGELKINQVALVTELKTLDIVKQTPIMSN